MPNYLLLLHHDPEKTRARSPDDMMAMVKEYIAWTDRMRKEGRIVHNSGLTDDPGRALRPKGGHIVVTDGPYAETKELVGGYYCITAADYDEACRIAESCPHLKYGAGIEVRQTR